MEFIKKIQTTFQKTSSILLKGGHSPPFRQIGVANSAYPPRRFLFPLSTIGRSPIAPIPRHGFCSPLSAIGHSPISPIPRGVLFSPFRQIGAANSIYPLLRIENLIGTIKRIPISPILRGGLGLPILAIKQNPQKKAGSAITLPAIKPPCEEARGASSPSKGREKCREGGGSPARRG